MYIICVGVYICVCICIDYTHTYIYTTLCNNFGFTPFKNQSRGGIKEIDRRISCCRSTHACTPLYSQTTDLGASIR